MTTQPDEKILSKIKKCLALATSSEPHEAAAAMRQAQKLMEIHGISQMDIKMQDIDEVDVKSKVSVSKVNPWELDLMSTVAKAFGCKLMWRHARSWMKDPFGAYIFIGLKSQVELAQYTAEVMQRKLLKARAEFTKTLTNPYMSRQNKTVQIDGFCTGWVRTIGKTVHEFAVADDVKALIEQKADPAGESKQADVKKKQLGSAGYHAGQEAAAGESIHRPMGAAAKNLMIGQ
jgi:hypothetical protein